MQSAILVFFFSSSFFPSLSLSGNALVLVEECWICIVLPGALHPYSFKASSVIKMETNAAVWIAFLHYKCERFCERHFESLACFPPRFFVCLI